MSHGRKWKSPKYSRPQRVDEIEEYYLPPIEEDSESTEEQPHHGEMAWEDAA